MANAVMVQPVVDRVACRVTVGPDEVKLTAREAALLEFLVVHPHSWWSRIRLLREVWGFEYGDAATVGVHMSRLRAKVSGTSLAGRLLTRRGLGYGYWP